jgi:hypothetical protein
MPVTLNEAVDYLLASATQSPARTRALAQYCIEGFAREGLAGVEPGKATEVAIPGLARRKDWNLAFVLAGRPRLLISLKSMLKNIPGSLPNRLDDLMGEAANVQHLAPEMVIGYVIVMDVVQDSAHRSGVTWIDFFEASLGKIAIRRAPLWNQGLVEGSWVIRIDTRHPLGERVSDPLETDQKGIEFFRALLAELYRREPTLRPVPGGPVR